MQATSEPAAKAQTTAITDYVAGFVVGTHARDIPADVAHLGKRSVLDGIGLDMERDFQSTYLDRAGDGPAMVQDGRAAALWGGGTGWPGFTTVARGPQGARFIAPTADERARIQAKQPFLKTLSIPAGAYPGQSETIVSVGSWSFILARAGLLGIAIAPLGEAFRRD